MQRIRPSVIGKIIFVACLFALYACNQTLSPHSVLNQAEQLMDERPDSALMLLDSIPRPEELNALQYNTYLLYHTQARDKTDKDITVDTLIFSVFPYFLSTHDAGKTALSALYCGRVSQERNTPEDAMQYYLQAAGYADRTTDENLKGLIHFYIGNLYYTKRSYEDAIRYYQQSYRYYHSSGKYTHEISTLSGIALSFLFNQQTDSASVYQQKAQALASLHQDTALMADLYQNIGIANRKIKEHRQAVDNFKQSLLLNKGKDKELTAYLYLNLAQAYNSLSQNDSTQYYIDLCLQAIQEKGNNSIQSQVYRLLSTMEKSRGHYQQALEYHELYTKRMIEIAENIQSQAIHEIQKKYNYELIANESNRHLITKQRTMLLLLLSILVLIGISFLFYRNHVKNKEAALEAARIIAQLKETASSFSEEKDTLRKVLFQRFDIVKKISLLECHINVDSKIAGKALIEKINKILYGDAATFDWATLYQYMNESRDGILDRIRLQFPELDETGFRICCLSYMGFSNGEISFLLRSKQSTIETKKSDMRQRIGAFGHVSLADFINKSIKNNNNANK